MKKFLTVLFLTGLLTASIAAAENSVKTAGTGKAILGISPDKKEITVTAVTADGSPVQVEGCTVTELPSDEETILTATGTKVVLKGNITELDCSSNELTALDVRGLTALQTLDCYNNRLTVLDIHGLSRLAGLYCSRNRLKEHALIQIINSLPERRTDEETEAVFYTEEDNRSEGNYTDWSSSAGLQAAIKTARAKNWTLYKQVGEEDFEELEVVDSVRD